MVPALHRSGRVPQRPSRIVRISHKGVQVPGGLRGSTEVLKVTTDSQVLGSGHQMAAIKRSRSYSVIRGSPSAFLRASFASSELRLRPPWQICMRTSWHDLGQNVSAEGRNYPGFFMIQPMDPRVTKLHNISKNYYHEITVILLTCA